MLSLTCAFALSSVLTTSKLTFATAPVSRVWSRPSSFRRQVVARASPRLFRLVFPFCLTDPNSYKHNEHLRIRRREVLRTEKSCTVELGASPLFSDGRAIHERGETHPRSGR